MCIRDRYYQQHKKEINYYRKCERELKQHLDQNGKVPTARWKREKEELQSVIEELKADNQPYQEELAFVKKVQSCADIARRDREMAETDTSGRSEEKRAVSYTHLCRILWEIHRFMDLLLCQLSKNKTCKIFFQV